MDRPLSDPYAHYSPARLGGFAVFRLRVSGQPDFEAIVPMSPMSERSMTLAFDNRDRASTGVAVVNASPDSSTVVHVVIRDMSGSVMLTDSFTLNPMAKLTFAMLDRYPSVNGTAGVMQLSTSALMLSALGLRFNPTGPFTSFHALSNPLYD